MADIISNTTLDGSYVQSDYVDYNDYVIIEIIYGIIYWITCIIICIDLPLALIAIYALFTLVQNNHVAPIYVINLLIADIFQHCCIITEAERSFYEHEFSRLVYAYIYSLMASVGFMVCLSLERYMVIACPLKHCFMHSIKMSGVVCVVVWALPLVFLLPFAFRVDFHVTISIFDLFFFLPFPLLIFFLGGTLKALSASISVPTNEKRQTVGILVLLLLIYMLFLPSLIWLMADSDRNDNILSYRAFVFHGFSGVRDLSILFIRVSPLAHLVLCVFMSKGAIDKLLTSLGCCKMGGNDINITV
ncbi:G-protein coupled receptor 4-like [Labrus mixtus]|uniref:G-protein coupled receptor 4-like n=1 Tax=Labrus mixtus TaxID=508554 RepID=UPI0029C00CBC|nr:G-protein coupled receptor 4-like [Labrus mixtus]